MFKTALITLSLVFSFSVAKAEKTIVFQCVDELNVTAAMVETKASELSENQTRALLAQEKCEAMGYDVLPTRFLVIRESVQKEFRPMITIYDPSIRAGLLYDLELTKRAEERGNLQPSVSEEYKNYLEGTCAFGEIQAKQLGISTLSENCW